mmetsp:Transcript_5452/g.11982  ORF Transcript_5452/g.11982 Transcript_5452/m.11982 type:complete len:1157 (+) Transcript_5452:48-3518(+)
MGAALRVKYAAAQGDAPCSELGASRQFAVCSVCNKSHQTSEDWLRSAEGFLSVVEREVRAGESLDELVPYLRRAGFLLFRVAGTKFKSGGDGVAAISRSLQFLRTFVDDSRDVFPVLRVDWEMLRNNVATAEVCLIDAFVTHALLPSPFQPAASRFLLRMHTESHGQSVLQLLRDMMKACGLAGSLAPDGTEKPPRSSPSGRLASLFSQAVSHSQGRVGGARVMDVLCVEAASMLILYHQTSIGAPQGLRHRVEVPPEVQDAVDQAFDCLSMLAAELSHRDGEAWVVAWYIAEVAERFVRTLTHTGWRIRSAVLMRILLRYSNGKDKGADWRVRTRSCECISAWHGDVIWWPANSKADHEASTLKTRRFKEICTLCLLDAKQLAAGEPCWGLILENRDFNQRQRVRNVHSEPCPVHNGHGVRALVADHRAYQSKSMGRALAPPEQKLVSHLLSSALRAIAVAPGEDHEFAVATVSQSWRRQFASEHQRWSRPFCDDSGRGHFATAAPSAGCLGVAAAEPTVPVPGTANAQCQCGPPDRKSVQLQTVSVPRMDASAGSDCSGREVYQDAVSQTSARQSVHVDVATDCIEELCADPDSSFTSHRRPDPARGAIAETDSSITHLCAVSIVERCVLTSTEARKHAADLVQQAFSKRALSRRPVADVAAQASADVKHQTTEAGTSAPDFVCLKELSFPSAGSCAPPRSCSWWDGELDLWKWTPPFCPELTEWDPSTAAEHQRSANLAASHCGHVLHRAARLCASAEVDRADRAAALCRLALELDAINAGRMRLEGSLVGFMTFAHRVDSTWLWIPWPVVQSECVATVAKAVVALAWPSGAVVLSRETAQRAQQAQVSALTSAAMAECRRAACEREANLTALMESRVSEARDEVGAAEVVAEEQHAARLSLEVRVRELTEAQKEAAALLATRSEELQILRAEHDALCSRLADEEVARRMEWESSMMAAEDMRARKTTVESNLGERLRGKAQAAMQIASLKQCRASARSPAPRASVPSKPFHLPRIHGISAVLLGLHKATIDEKWCLASCDGSPDLQSLGKPTPVMEGIERVPEKWASVFHAEAESDGSPDVANRQRPGPPSSTGAKARSARKHHQNLSVSSASGRRVGDVMVGAALPKSARPFSDRLTPIRDFTSLLEGRTR